MKFSSTILFTLLPLLAYAQDPAAPADPNAASPAPAAPADPNAASPAPAAPADPNAGGAAGGGEAAPAQVSDPLTDKHFTYPDLPFQVDTDDGPRGTQQGYNLCNSTTENQDSLCQTAWVNNLTDWCLWSSPTPNGVIGDIEGETVAWCTKAGHGTRLIPAGAIRGAQWIVTPDYVQVAGIIDQAAINLASDDSGGEMDPFGADRRGNPLGGLVFSNAFGAGNSSNDDGIQQVQYWHNFMGANQFCFKACNPASPNGLDYCQHIYDRMGCNFNVIADYANLEGRFETCESDNALPPGIYVENGATMTFDQGPEGVAPNPPYQPSIPSSSNCRTFASSDIFSDITSVSADPAESTMPISNTLGVSGNTSPSAASDSSESDDDSAAQVISSNGLVTFIVPAALIAVSFFAVLI